MTFRWFILAESSTKSEDRFFYKKSLQVLINATYKNISVDLIYIYKDSKKVKMYRFDKNGFQESETDIIPLKNIIKLNFTSFKYDGIIFSGHALWGGTEFFEYRKKYIKLTFKDVTKILKQNNSKFHCIIFDMCLCMHTENIELFSPYTNYLIGSASYHGNINVFDHKSFFSYKDDYYLSDIMDQYNMNKDYYVSLIDTYYGALLVNKIKKLKRKLVFNKATHSRNRHYKKRYDLYTVIMRSQNNISETDYKSLLKLFKKTVIKMSLYKKPHNNGLAIDIGWLNL
jgi:WD40 repeat protein